MRCFTWTPPVGASYSSNMAIFPLDDVPYSRIMEYMPDQGQHCEVIKDWLVGTLRERFCFSPFLLSCFTCLAANKDMKKTWMKANLPQDATTSSDMSRKWLNTNMSGSLEMPWYDAFAPTIKDVLGQLAGE